MKRVIVVFSLLAGVSCFAGDLTGKITPPGKCKTVTAVSRMMKLEYKGTINSRTGEYAVKKLPAGRVDLVLVLDDAAIQGVDLSPDPFDKADEPLTEEDRKTVSKWVVDNFEQGKEFENKGRAIYIEGNAKYCKALVEKIRDRAFHAGKGEAVYRVEIWPFDKLYGTWRKRAHSEQVIVRERLSLPEYAKKAYFFDPKLGGIEVKERNEPTTFDYSIPGKLDAAMGKAAE